MQPFNGDYYDKDGNIKNLVENGKAPTDHPKNEMIPFNGDFYTSNGEIKNISELGGGGGQPPFDEKTMEMIELMGSFVNRKDIFRGKNLGSSYTEEQKATIKAGVFEDLYLGDYWEINDVKWRIWDFDYSYGMIVPNNNTHHVVILPDSGINKSVMNTESTTSGGYRNSELRTVALLETLQIVQDAFGENSILTTWERIVSSVDSTGSAIGTAQTTTKIEIPSEVLLTGYSFYTPWSQAVTVSSIRQLALARVAPSFRSLDTKEQYWLRDIVTSTQFLYWVSDYMGAANAINPYWVRPIFSLS